VVQIFDGVPLGSKFLNDEVDVYHVRLEEARPD
jgi:hypothetical protein